MIEEKFESVVEMLNAINSYVKRHDGAPKIVAVSDPRRLLIGFQCKESERCWFAKLAIIRKGNDGRLFSEREREKLCNRFGKQKYFRRVKHANVRV